jgi:hypothetical protein
MTGTAIVRAGQRSEPTWGRARQRSVDIKEAYEHIG